MCSKVHRHLIPHPSHWPSESSGQTPHALLRGSVNTGAALAMQCTDRHLVPNSWVAFTSGAGNRLRISAGLRRTSTVLGLELANSREAITKELVLQHHFEPRMLADFSDPTACQTQQHGPQTTATYPTGVGSCLKANPPAPDWCSEAAHSCCPSRAKFAQQLHPQMPNSGCLCREQLDAIMWAACCGTTKSSPPPRQSWLRSPEPSRTESRPLSSVWEPMTD